MGAAVDHLHLVAGFGQFAHKPHRQIPPRPPARRPSTRLASRGASRVPAVQADELQDLLGGGRIVKSGVSAAMRPRCAPAPRPDRQKPPPLPERSVRQKNRSRTALTPANAPGRTRSRRTPARRRRRWRRLVVHRMLDQRVDRQAAELGRQLLHRIAPVHCAAERRARAVPLMWSQPCRHVHRLP